LASSGLILRIGFREHPIFEIWFLILLACICQFPARTMRRTAAKDGITEK
jgi:hypothetical protein